MAILRRISSQFLPALLVLLMVHSAKAQEPSLSIGPVRLQIGMPQSATIDSLSRYYTLTEYKPNAYNIAEKERSTITGYMILVGQAVFEKGKLIYASKDWFTSEVLHAYSFAEALHAVVSQMEQRGETMATVKTRAVREPNVTIQEVIIRFGKRQISITASDYKSSKNVSITESIRSTPFTY